MNSLHDQHHEHDHDLGLAADLPQLLLQRRHVLRLLGGGTLLALAGCAAKTVGATGTTTATSVASSDTSDSAGACTPIPEETGGPFPGDGSNGPNALAESGIVRSDITSSIGSSSTVAEGVPVTITLMLTDTANGCTALAGAAVYIWQCDRSGRYSMYSEGVTEENYLRGVQESDADGRVVFQSIVPGAYSGRWPHIHFEVYPTLDEATSAGEPLVTSQIALPEDMCAAVYATEGYEQSVSNLAQTSLESDNVFGDDGGVSQLATVAGDIETGLNIELAVGV